MTRIAVKSRLSAGTPMHPVDGAVSISLSDDLCRIKALGKQVPDIGIIPFSFMVVPL